jgi:hypothetical protein
MNESKSLSNRKSISFLNFKYKMPTTICSADDGSIPGKDFVLYYKIFVGVLIFRDYEILFLITTTTNLKNTHRINN